MPTIRIAGLAACVTLVIASCSSTTEPTNSSSATTTAITSAPKASALKTMDPKAFQATVQGLATDLMVPGAVVVLRTPQGNFTASVGTTELGAQTPPKASTHFRIASNTKTMTAALIALLAQDGKLKFGDPVSAYVPGVPNGENITVAELLKMRTGLYGYTADPELAAMMDATPSKSWTPQEVLAIAFRHPAQFAPDAEYEYSNTNYALLGLVAEKVGGQPLAQQFQERLFGPVGLEQTSLPAADDTAIPAPYSHGYMYGGSFYALADDPYPADMQTAAKAGTLKPIDYTNQNSSYATAAGGAISTADDLATWMKALVSGRVFSTATARNWRSPPSGGLACHSRSAKAEGGVTVANFGESNTWIQDSDKFELYADGSGKVRLRPAPGEPVEPDASRAGDGIGITSVPMNTFDARLVSPTDQVLHRVDPDVDGDESS